MTNSIQGLSSEKTNSEYTEISIWLDSYDEMFSDFDPRPYSKRTVSDDFISQVRKVVKDRYRKKMMLNLLLSEATRNQQEEQVISERIHNHFKLIHEQLLEEKRKNNRRGFLLTITGILLMITASYISFLKSESYYTHMLLILVEPAGWFMLWIGLDTLIYYSGKTRKELNFYAHMARAEIQFSTYYMESNKLT